MEYLDFAVLLDKTPHFFEKFSAVVFSFMYFVFALVVVRQVKLMSDTLDVGFETELKIVAFSHLVFSLVVFIFSLII